MATLMPLTMFTTATTISPGSERFPTGCQKRHNLYRFSTPARAPLNLNYSRVGKGEHVSHFIVFLRFKRIEM